MTSLGLALMSGSALAQTAKDIVGTWKQVTNINIAPDGRRSEPFGANPNAIITFDANGRFVTVTTRPDVPKFASNNRMQGTAEENKAMVQGGIAYFGTYSVAQGSPLFRSGVSSCRDVRLRFRGFSSQTI
jgi:hypothetical protein